MTEPEREEVSVADIEVDEVRPVASGFTLLGRGSDATDYRLEMHLDLPVDRQTRAVLAELLSQCELRIWRRVPPPIRKSTHRSRKQVG